MNEVDDNTKEELFEEFLEESDEMIMEMEGFSMNLESNPNDMESIHGIFRGAHSIKGNSSFFGLTPIQALSHQFENYLDIIRDGGISVSQDVVSFILEGSDHLKAVIGRLRAEREKVSLTASEQEYLERIYDKIGEQSEGGRKEELRIELLKFFNKCREDGQLQVESPPNDLFEAISRLAPDLVEDRREKAESENERWKYGALDVSREFIALRKFSEQPGDDDAFAKDPYTVFMDNIDGLIAKHLADELEEPLPLLEDLKDNFQIFYQDEIGVDEILASSIAESMDEYAKALTYIKIEVKPKAETATGGASKDNEKVVKSKTMRIQERLLDDLIYHVGELITTNELFNAIQRRIEQKNFDGLSSDMKSTNQAFGEISTQLQKLLYEIRKVPFDRTLSKLPGIVRNIAKNSDKAIQVKMTGGETEVDKSLLDKIDSILVHCIRNCADHGVETRSEREACGKAPEGLIEIDVNAKDNRLFVSVKDDGKGVDISRVRKKAVDKGLYSPEVCAQMPDQEALDILLTPGFSTAEKVTETSGRGVGMDVLGSYIHDMGGKLKLNNNPGKGFGVEMSMPLAYTTMIKLGLTLGVGDNVFLVPAENVRESFKVTREETGSVEGRGEVVQRWGNIFPILRLGELFGVEPKYDNIWDAICVMVESKGKTICLLVDEMLGQRQIVYKQLNLKTREPNAFEGISILDGRHMALILSVDGLIKQFQE